MAAPSRSSDPNQGSAHLFAAPLLLLTGLLGCASPGAPRPPSLNLPKPATDLVITRSGDVVDLQFTTPTETSDNLPLRSHELHASLCLQATPHGPCVPVDLPKRLTALHGPLDPLAPGQPVHWQDQLPEALRQGSLRPIAYRLDLRNEAGRSAGSSAPAYALAGAAPAPVSNLVTEGTRLGVLLHWSPESQGGQVLLERDQLTPEPLVAARPPRPSTPAPSKHRLTPRKARGKHPATAPQEAPRPTHPEAVWLNAEPGPAHLGEVLDNSVLEGDTYRYTAFRRLILPWNGRTLEVLSTASSPREIAWQDIYPPPAPTGLTALGFTSPAPVGGGDAPTYAIDLVWEPVADTRLAGYLVRRTPLSPSGHPTGATIDLTPSPVQTPAFHDTTALRTETYRYDVQAVDAKGNHSSTASTELQAVP